MLVLTRRVGESLKIGTEITITVLSIKGNQVRIGATAPMDTEIHREEIFERIQSELEHAVTDKMSEFTAR